MKFLDTLHGKKNDIPPIWIMRQAGRYLTEYRDIRSTEKNFMKFCLSAEKTSEVTCQPIDKFNMDAAIIFSDILLVLHMLNRKVSFIADRGPLIERLNVGEKITFKEWDTFKRNLKPVSDSINLTKYRLKKKTPLIGFSGSPWTLFTYLIEGGSSRDFSNARNFLWSAPKNVEEIFEVLVEAIINFLDIQLEAGVDAIMLFDSWAGAIPSRFRERFILEPTKMIIKHIRRKNPSAPVICFPKSIGEGVAEFVDVVEPDCIAIDHLTDINFVHKTISKNVVIQGNIDPICLVNGGAVMKKEIDYLLNLMSDRPYIFNLGHGILPNTPETNVTNLISYIREKIWNIN